MEISVWHHENLVGGKDVDANPPEGFYFPLYTAKLSSVGRVHNRMQQELDKIDQRCGHPSIFLILKSWVMQTVRKTPKSYLKPLTIDTPKRVQKMTDYGGIQFK